MSTEEVLRMEISSLHRSREFLERSRDEAVAKVRDLSIQNQELVLKMKKLQLIDSSRYSGIESELKLKKFELERCSLLLSESEEKQKQLCEEKDKLIEKLDVIKEEYSNLRCDSEKKVASLRLQMKDKATRLDLYEKLERELDELIVKAASLPEGPDSDRLLTVYGYGTNIPSSAKRRLEHSISLARRVMELERLSTELKEDLFKERDTKNHLQSELTIAKSSLLFLDYPTSELLELLRKREAEILKHVQEIRDLKSQVNSLKISEGKLKVEVAAMHQYKVSIEETLEEIRRASKNQIEVRENKPPPIDEKRRVTFKTQSRESESDPKYTRRNHRSRSVDGLSVNYKPLTLTKIKKDLWS